VAGVEGAGRAKRVTPPGNFWFRGHADATWDLKPKLYRPDTHLKLEDEDEDPQRLQKPGAPSPSYRAVCGTRAGGNV
jgi:hypothetical protein